MTEKTEFIKDWYWSANPVAPKEYITNRLQKIYSNTVLKGLLIGMIDPGVRVVIDEAECENGWKRIYYLPGIDGYVYQDWKDKLAALGIDQGEAWIDQSALTVEAPVEPDPEPEPEPDDIEIAWEFRLFGWTVTIWR